MNTSKMKFVAATLASAALIAGCNKSETAEAEGTDLSAQALAAAEASGFRPPDGGDGGELHIYTWSDYIAPDVLESFEKALGVKVIVDTIMEDTSHRTYEKGVERLMREPVTILELATIGPGVMNPGIGHREESRHTDGRGLRGGEVDREVGRLGTP